MRLEDQKRARELRSQGWTLPEIAKEVLAGKGLVSLWVRDVKIAEEGLARLTQREASLEGGSRLAMARCTWSRQRKSVRECYREEGRLLARKGESLHALACGLYWGEGTKSKNIARIVNSDIYIMMVFLNFCRNYFDVKNEEISLCVSGYTSVHDSQTIVSYWIKGLMLEGVKLEKHSFDNYSYVSKGVSGTKIGKLPHGTCRITIKKSTRIVQHIYGALEVYGGMVMDPKK